MSPGMLFSLTLFYIQFNIMNYYPLKRVRDKLSPEDAQMVATPTAKKGWSYLFADKDGEWLRVESDAHHHLTSITYTPKFRSL